MTEVNTAEFKVHFFFFQLSTNACCNIHGQRYEYLTNVTQEGIDDNIPVVNKLLYVSCFSLEAGKM